MFDKDKHLGHIIFECLRSRPDSICQIDASTGVEETNASVLARSVQLARCLRRLGLVPGDVLMLSGKNHNDLQIPYGAALLDGLPITGIDPSYKLNEVKNAIKITEPKIAFCEPESYEDYVQASTDLGLATQVFTFGTGERSMLQLLDSNKDDTPVEEFEIATFDMDKVYAWLVTSGGTTGVLKVAAVKHDAVKHKLQNLQRTEANKGDKPHEPILQLSSIQWLSGILSPVSMPFLRQTKIQTSAPATPEHVIDIINKYKPLAGFFVPSASLISGILRSEKPCDLTCFRVIKLAGGKVYQDLFLKLKEKASKTAIVEMYGLTETLGVVLIPDPLCPPGSCGRTPVFGLQVKLMNLDTGKEITEPNVTGELWTKGVCFSCYYNNSEETATAFTEDGWYKTGDLLYRDEDNNYFFVERLKTIILYREHHVLPLQIEAVIHSHEAVADVSVTSVPHEEDGEHPVACVVTRRGATVTSREIKELVASKLPESNQLRGGVVFLEQLPMTHAGKVAKGKLRQLVINMHRE